MAKVPFKRIRERAAKRKGGDKVLASLLPKKPNNKALAKLPDDRVLADMAERIFSAVSCGTSATAAGSTSKRSRLTDGTPY